MKKLISFVVIATTLVLGFTSCDKKDEPQPAGITFTLMVDNITATTATVHATPSDTSVYYYVGMFYADEPVATSANSIAKYLQDEYGMYGWKILKRVLFKRKAKTEEYTGLPYGKDWVVVAVALDSTLSPISEVTRTTFSTPEMVIEHEETYQMQGSYTDHREEAGNIYVRAIAENGNTFYMDIYSDDLEGKFSIDDMFAYNSYVVTSEKPDEKITFVAADITCAFNETGEYIVAGYVDGENGTRYHLTITCPVK